MRRSLLLVLVVLIAACGDLSSGQAGAPASASPSVAGSRAAVPQPDCLELAQLPSRIATPLAVRDLGDGTKQVTSAEGGYTFVVPAAWPVASGLLTTGLFGQAHASSFDPATAPTPRPEVGPGILPPQVGVRLDVEVWLNLGGEALDAYADRVRIGPDQIGRIGGEYVTVAGRRAYRFTIQDEHKFQPNNAPLVDTKQQRAVWLVPTTRPDRVLVVYVTPIESGLFALAERAVATLQVTDPVPTQLPVTIQRSEVLAQWLTGKSGPIVGRRAEAKLMTYAEASAAMNARDGTPGAPTASGLFRVDHDPDELFWVVAVSGPDLPEGRRGPMSAGTLPPTAWLLYETAATAGGHNASTGGTYAAATPTSGTWPPVFDALADRCH